MSESISTKATAALIRDLLAEGDEALRHLHYLHGCAVNAMLDVDAPWPAKLHVLKRAHAFLAARIEQSERMIDDAESTLMSTSDNDPDEDLL